MDLNQVFSFIRLTQKFRSVVRDVKIEDEARFENDMEHSFQLALFLWYLNSAHKLPYNTDKLIKYAIIHDLVEVYAGDVPGLTSSSADISSKSAKEEKALAQIMSEHPEFKDLESTWHNYQKKSDKESQLVYVIDKIMPILNEIQQDSGFYKKNKVRLAKWKSWLQTKTNTVDLKVLDDGGLLEALLVYLEDQKERFFFK